MGLMAQRMVGCWLALMVSIGVCSAQENAWPKQRTQSLKGLKGVCLKLQVEPEYKAEKHGLDLHQLRTQIELKLRQSGIAVVSEAEWMKTPRRPKLWVMVSLLKHGRMPARYVYVLNMPLYQDATIEGVPGNPFHVCTWWARQYMGICESKKLSEKVEAVIWEQLDHFMNDFLSANPK